MPTVMNTLSTLGCCDFFAALNFNQLSFYPFIQANLSIEGIKGVYIMLSLYHTKVLSLWTMKCLTAKQE